MTQRQLIDLDRRRDSAHDRFMCEQASDVRVSGALGKLLLAFADGDGVDVTTNE